MGSEICSKVEKVFESNRVIPFTQRDFLSGVGGPLSFSMGCFATISIISFHAWCMLRGSV